MKALNSIRNNILDESAAYGYTLSIWGSGAMLIQSSGLTAESVLAFVLGGLTGFAFLTAVAFRGIFMDIEKESGETIVASMIHVLASFGSVLITYLIVQNLNLEVLHMFFLIGAHTTVTYNVMMVLEEYISRDIYRFEKE